MQTTRRAALKTMLASSIGLGLRSMVTGIPPAFWLTPAKALAQEGAQDAALAPAQYIIYSTSGSGDPINCNAPGTYDHPDIVHGKDPSMAATNVVQNGVARKGAQIWSTLPSSMLDRMAFVHHGTYTIIHTELNKVMRLQGAVNQNNMLPCALASALGPRLGSIINQPLCLYGDLNAALIDKGIPLPMHPPASLRNVLGVPRNALGSKQMMQLRDKSLDALNAWGKTQAKEFQKDFIDRYALSQSQARSVQEKLGTTLNNITDNSITSQINLAIALFQLKLAPVAAVSIDFGGDNHVDGLGDGQFSVYEVPKHQTGVATLANMQKRINDAGMGDQVSFMLSNVFGRNLGRKYAENGRGHNDGHAITLMYGPNIKGGVIGGVTPNKDNTDFVASAISSRSGAADSAGDIAYSDTLASMGKTFTAAVGGDITGNNFRSGSIIPSIIKDS